jgi:hypothetical protein
MKRIINFTLAAFLIVILQSCGTTVNVLNSWKGNKEAIQSFKEKKILVIARTADNSSRLPFEIEIANKLRSKGFNATESFKKAPKLHPEVEMTEERKELMQTLMSTEGFTGIVITTVKDKESITSTTTNGVYVGGSYGSYYPGHYGGFNNYYNYPYASGGYYSGFGGYVPTSTSTSTRTNYVLETVAYNLDKGEEDQLIAVITTEIKDPKDAYKAAAKYVEKIMEALEDK